jgi:hypothetical protein
VTAAGSGPSPSSFVKLRRRVTKASELSIRIFADPLPLALILSLTKDEGGPDPAAV